MEDMKQRIKSMELISSGETQQLLEQWDEWLLLYEDYGDRPVITPSDPDYDLYGASLALRWDALDVMSDFDDPLLTSDDDIAGDARPFLNAVSRLRSVPVSSMLLSFLMIANGISIGPANMERMRKMLENLQECPSGDKMASEEQICELEQLLNRDEKQACPDLTEENGLYTVYSLLSERTRDVFCMDDPALEGDESLSDERTLPVLDGHWHLWFFRLLKKPDAEQIRRTAFAYRMSFDRYVCFLQKILHKSRPALLNREEVFTKITLDCTPPEETCSRCLQRLRELYPVDSADSRDNSRNRNTADTEAVDIPAWLLRGNAGNLPLTLRFENELSEIEKEAGRDLFRTVSRRLQEYLEWAGRNAETRRIIRTAEEVFFERWNKLYVSMKDSWEVKEFIKSSRRRGMDTDLYRRKLTLAYAADNTAERIIPAGTVLTCDTRIRDNGIPVRAVFTFEKECRILPDASDEEEIDVEVEELTTLSGSGPEDPVPAERQILIDNLYKATRGAQKVREKHLITVIGRGRSKQEKKIPIRLQSENPLLNDRILEILPGQNILYFADDRKKSKPGMFRIRCKVGTVIPAGTVIGFEKEGISFSYRTVRECSSLQKWNSVEVDVLWDRQNLEMLEKKLENSRRNAQSREKETVVTRNTVFSLKDPAFTGSVRISNPAPLALRPGPEIGQDTSVRRSANIKNMLEFIYDSNGMNDMRDFHGVDSYGPGFLFNTDAFKRAQITQNTLSHFPVDEERRRNLLLTVDFLDFVMNEIDLLSANDRDLRVDQLFDEFRYIVDQDLERCGMQEFYPGNAYEGFLSMLFSCENPFELFQALFEKSHHLSHYFTTESACEQPVWIRILARREGKEEVWAEWEAPAGNLLYTVPRLTWSTGTAYYVSVRWSDGSRMEKQIPGSKKTYKDSSRESVLRIQEGTFDLV